MELRKPDMLYMGSAQLRSWGRRGKSNDVSSTYENSEVQRVKWGFKVVTREARRRGAD
jgi:hypothetical protein